VIAIAYVILRDEVSIVEELVAHHLRQGVQIVAIDNGSTDGTLERLEQMRGRDELLAYEVRATESYAWAELVSAGLALAKRYSPDWIIHIDANTFLESSRADAGRSLRDDIEDADKAGYNVLPLEVFDFYPTGDDDPGEASHYQRVRHYTPRVKLSRLQEKIFRCHPGVSSRGGHEIVFPPHVEKRVSPSFAVMRHYMFRSSQQGVEKLLRRKNRWDEEERRSGAHNHYDGYLGYAAETVVPAACLHRKDEGSPWRREMMYERPEALFSEHHDFNASGWFDREVLSEKQICCVIGAQRSGTTLLRLVFESHPDVTVFEEPGSYDYWADRPLLDRTLQAERAHGKRLFVFKVPCLTQQFDAPDRVARELRYHVFPFRFFYEGQLLVFMVRDPRDVCLSLQGLKVRSSGDDWIDHWPRYVDELYPHVMPDFQSRYARELEVLARAGSHAFAARAALYWKIKTEAYLRYDAMGYTVRLVMYEDLVTRPRQALAGLCRFLQIPFHDRLLRHHEQSHAAVGAHGLTVGDTDPRRPIDGGATRLYKAVMPIEEQRVIMEIAGDTYCKVQRKWQQQLRNDLLCGSLPDAATLPTP
jgi:hypothetical protein